MTSFSAARLLTSFAMSFFEKLRIWSLSQGKRKVDKFLLKLVDFGPGDRIWTCEISRSQSERDTKLRHARKLTFLHDNTTKIKRQAFCSWGVKSVDLLLKREGSKQLDALQFFMLWGKESGEHGPKTPLSWAEWTGENWETPQRGCSGGGNCRKSRRPCSHNLPQTPELTEGEIAIPWYTSFCR